MASIRMFRRSRLRFALTSFCLGMILLNLAVFWLSFDQAVSGLPDFRIFYTAGLMLRRGQGHVLYSDDLQLKTQREFTTLPSGVTSLLPYNHPPFEAILYVPLTYLPYVQAYFLWILLNGLLLMTCIYVIRPWIPALTSEFPRLLFLVPLAFFPVAFALMEGQDSILLLAMYCAAYVAFRRKLELPAGIFLGLGLFKFHLVLPFAFVLLLHRRWRAIAGMAISGCCELALSWALVGWKELIAYPRYAWHVNRDQTARVIVPENMANLRGLFTGWANLIALRPWLELLLLAASLCLLVWASRRWWPGESPDSDAWKTGFSITVIVTFLVGYHGYNQDLSIVLLPILITLDSMLRKDAVVAGTALRVVLVLMFFTPIYLVLTLHYQHQNLFSLVLLAFAGCLAAYAARNASGGSTQPATVSSGAELRRSPARIPGTHD